MRWFILALGVACATFAMVGNYGCVNRYFLEQKELEEDTTIGSGVQYCELTEITGTKKYYVFSNKRRLDSCEEFR